MKLRLLDTNTIIHKMYDDIFESGDSFDNEYSLVKYSIVMRSLVRFHKSKSFFGTGCLFCGLLTASTTTTAIPIAAGYTLAIFGARTLLKAMHNKAQCKFFFNSLIDILMEVHKLSDKDITDILNTIPLDELVEFLQDKKLVEEKN